VGTVTKSNRKIVETGRIDTPSTHIYNLHVPGFVQALQFRWQS